jgi:isoleucyl-tRNA synthetase
MSDISFPKLEEEILKFWEKEEIFNKTLAKDSPQGEFVFYEGPPTANGKPGIHHVLARAFKDLIPRYKTMRGFHVARKAGWDTHGLPVELQVEKELGISGKPQIEALQSSVNESIKFFNEKCQQSVWQYKEEWEKLTKRMGFWLDLEHPYVTYENDYIETLWWIMKQVHEKGLLYKGYKVVPHCPRCGTALSSHEVAQGYREVKDESVFIKFKVKKGNDKVQVGDFILSWTTTPWTLPGNVALAVGSDFDYVKIRIMNNELGIKENIVLAKARLDIFNDYELLEEFKGSELIGVEYEQLFSDAISESVKNYENAFKVYSADFVTTEDGTGVVHTAVMYGEDDYNLGEQVGLPKYHTVNESGKFQFPDAQGILKELDGLPVKHKDKPTEEKTTQSIISYLKKNNLLLKTELYKHDYPFCWRCDTPLLYYAKDSWFIKMSALREQLQKNNAEVNWVPEHIKQGRFGEWLDGVKDWAISRERYWGTPLPVWECDACHKLEVIGSRDDLRNKGVIVDEKTNLHRPFIDEVKFSCECGGQMYRDKSVLDCWFDSGAMPFAQLHYPFENKDLIDQQRWFPADFICEAIDQTRGWFYTLLAISTLLGKPSPYKNVICLGHINDKHGKKMSKSKGNIVDPWTIMEQYGVDALRWHLYTLNQPGEPKNFDPVKVEEVIKKNWLILWNMLTFYKLYAVGQEIVTTEKNHVLDRWILAETKSLVQIVSERLDSYDITTAARSISDFINILSTWYIRRSRPRFKAGNQDSLNAMHTLGEVLLTVSRLLAPFVPFLSEKLFQELKITNETIKQDSVHLTNWPQILDLTDSEKQLLINMSQVRDIVTQALALRAEAKIKIRQPLRVLEIMQSELTPDYIEILQDEINVRQIKLSAQSMKLDTVIDEELIAAGQVREIIRSINNLRKQSGLTIQDRAVLHIEADQYIIDLINKELDEIKFATLMRAVVFSQIETEYSQKIELGKHSFWLGIIK